MASTQNIPRMEGHISGTKSMMRQDLYESAFINAKGDCQTYIVTHSETLTVEFNAWVDLISKEINSRRL
jgi:hypothetical protein